MTVRRFGYAGLLVVAALAPGLSACGLLGPDEWEQRRRALDSNRINWQNHNVQSYRFTISKSCECIPGFFGPVQIVVENGAIVSVTPFDEDRTVPPDQWPAFDTVDELFSRIESAITSRAHQFSVQYDASHGFPVLISLDIDARMVDDEVLVQVRDFVVLD